MDDLLRVKADLYEITAIPGTKIQYPNVNSGAAWMANTDLDENGTKGVWHDYYTKEPVGQDLLDAVIGTLEPSCAVNLEVVTDMFMKYFWLARELKHFSPKKYQSIYRVSQKNLGSRVYANVSSESSHLEITKDSFEIYRTSAFQNCPYF